MKVYLLLTVLLLSTSCLKIPGNIKINSDLDYNFKDGLRKLQKGNYQASIKIKSTSKIIIKTSTDRGQHKIIIKLPDEIKLPRDHNESHRFSVESLNQPFRINGLFKNLISFSNPILAEESCRLNTTSGPCANIWIGNRENRSLGYYDYRCIPNYVMGVKDIWYRKKTKKIMLNFNLIQNGVDKAEFEGETTSFSRERISESPCSLY